LFIGLLVLRLPVLTLAGFFPPIQDIVFVIYLLGTYLSVGLWMLCNVSCLHESHFSLSTVILFLAAPLLGLATGNDDPTLWARLSMAAFFAVMLWRRRKQLSLFRQSWKASLVNVLIVGAAIPLLALYQWICMGFATNPSGDPVTFAWAAHSMGFQLAFAGISEEPLFRGILWGYLRRRNLPSLAVCLIQAFLFWVGHVYYWQMSSFWLITPVISVALGLIVWRTKNASHSTVVHVVLNTAGDLLRHMRW
jgi:membrane protease YdiL (CAAX protease family)